MGKIRRPGKVKLVAALLSSDAGLFDKAKEMMERALKNRVDFESAVLDFSHTDYYEDEMGPALKRKFFAFEKALPLKGIEKTKLLSNRIEDRLAKKGRRAVNIDPGYLDLSKLVLFSTKDYSHRIHAGNGIFAEVTLYFKGGTFTPWPWTYPDYKTGEYLSIFNAIRQNYKKCL